jgi:protoporphyrinogen oxidase
MNLILGAGLAGLSASFHLGHKDCVVLEKESYPFGHLHAELRDGFTWDEGPHVSFTKSEYVRDLFAASVCGEFDDYEVLTGNYFKGHWIDHPAQSSLYQVPEPLRSRCVESFLASRSSLSNGPPENYQEWLNQTFGPVFAETFPGAYTRKYWTVEAKSLTTEWLGERVYNPAVEDVLEGSKGPLNRPTHYITRVRYPQTGGFERFAQSLFAGANVRYGAEVSRLDLTKKMVWTATGEAFPYTRLVNTLPLPVFVEKCSGVPLSVREAAAALSCSQILLVNTMAAHPTVRPENWIYIYEEDKLSTRVNCTEKMTPENAPPGTTGVQTEVYFSRHRPLPMSVDAAASTVVNELISMGLVRADSLVGNFTRMVQWGNVIFTRETKGALEEIWGWLQKFGLAREEGDTHPLPPAGKSTISRDSSIAMAGRYGQWKYLWTDDCVLRGLALAGAWSLS